MARGGALVVLAVVFLAGSAATAAALLSCECPSLEELQERLRAPGGSCYDALSEASSSCRSSCLSSAAWRVARCDRETVMRRLSGRVGAGDPLAVLVQEKEQVRRAHRSSDDENSARRSSGKGGVPMRLQCGEGCESALLESGSASSRSAARAAGPGRKKKRRVGRLAAITPYAVPTYYMPERATPQQSYYTNRDPYDENLKPASWEGILVHMRRQELKMQSADSQPHSRLLPVPGSYLDQREEQEKQAGTYWAQQQLSFLQMEGRRSGRRRHRGATS